MLPPSTTSAASASSSDRLSPREYESPKRKRHASGLGNLGNTCFMNSTLQCLAHTDPLRRYFLSGEYKGDLNRNNPLGTGGELATQFAELLEEMWTSRSSYGAVYPRNFKYALGKHAEQFLGYDQHDSQEFATYLLDALHEDTNRITKKPYIEKPEQKDDETDDVAADIAWKLHLRREDSRVLENFMGQVKSRVQCPSEGCGRVSTTFDPFMYLSVPIPGATDRSMQVTLVPLQGKNQKFTISLSKTRAEES
jgi:ubiquitin C-terminal hydrolase